MAKLSIKFTIVFLQPSLPPSAVSRFRATLYACPDTAPERQQVRLQVAARIEEVEDVLKNTTAVKDVSLRKIAQSVEEWQQKVGGEGSYSINTDR